jgi:hypothetical protein
MSSASASSVATPNRASPRSPLGAGTRDGARRLEILAGLLSLFARCLPASTNVNGAFGLRAGRSWLPRGGPLFFASGALFAITASLLSARFARCVARLGVALSARREHEPEAGAPSYGEGLAPP